MSKLSLNIIVVFFLAYLSFGLYQACIQPALVWDRYCNHNE